MTHSIFSPCEIATGLDLGDKQSFTVTVKRGGEILDERKVRTSRSGMRKHFEGLEPRRVVLEAGAQSAWVSELLTELGHEVVVANPTRAGALIRSTGRKNDKIDAGLLAQLGLDHVHLLRPIRHRSRESQVDMARLLARDNLVSGRTKFVNAVRSQVKLAGHRLPKCSPESLPRHFRAAKDLPVELVDALAPLVDQIEALNEGIKKYDAQIKEALKRYPETEQFQKIGGVGPITALAFILVIEDPMRFSKSRKVGAYLGLVPGQHESGSVNPQKRISKQGNPFLRRLLVSAAQYILGPFGPDCDLRTVGERLSATGGKRGKKRAVVAVARKLAVLMHRLWVSGDAYDPHWSSNKLAA